MGMVASGSWLALAAVVPMAVLGSLLLVAALVPVSVAAGVLHGVLENGLPKVDQYSFHGSGSSGSSTSISGALDAWYQADSFMAWDMVSSVAILVVSNCWPSLVGSGSLSKLAMDAVSHASSMDWSSSVMTSSLVIMAKTLATLLAMAACKPIT